MDVVALLVIVITTLASIVVAILTLREMTMDDEELSNFVAFDHLPRRD